MTAAALVLLVVCPRGSELQVTSDGHTYVAGRDRGARWYLLPLGAEVRVSSDSGGRDAPCTARSTEVTDPPRDSVSSGWYRVERPVPDDPGEHLARLVTIGPWRWSP